jgi:predicted ribosome-associated RNA-binding protein Tma20
MPRLAVTTRFAGGNVPTVYAVHKLNDSFDFSAAEDHGAVKVVFEGGMDLDDTGALQRRAAEKMAGFSEGDALLLSGGKILNALAVAFALPRVSKLRLLNFVKVRGAYTLHIIEGGKP